MNLHYSSRRIAGILCGILFATLLAFSDSVFPTARVAHAAGTTWHVTSTADGVATPANCPGASCRLRDAIVAASSGDTIDFQLTLPATITLAQGQLSFSTDLTILGSTTSTIAVSGNSASRVFSIGTSHASISDLTIRDGNVPGNQGGGILTGATTFLTLTNTTVISNTSQDGAGMFNSSGVVTLISSSLRNNLATQSGGGVYNNGSGASLSMTNTVISNNVASIGSGGGILSGGSVTITNSTISNNQVNGASSTGGGIYNVGGLTINNSTINGNQITIGDGGGGGIYASSSITMTLTNVTISGNSSFPAGNGWGGGILSTNTPSNLSHVTIVNNRTGSNSGGGIRTTGLAQFSIKNTLIAGNSSSSGPDCSPGATINSDDYNLIQNLSGCPLTGSTTHNLTGVNPKLSALGSWGGSTQTHGLLSGSPALDAIPNATNGCGTTYTTDQRGMTRPQNINCDIGAFEGFLNGIYLPLVFR